MVLRLDIRHWLHRWDAVLIKQTHAKYAAFMRSMAGAVLAYCDQDLSQLISAVGKDDARYASMSDIQMMQHLKPHQLKTYVRRMTRGVEVSRHTSLTYFQWSSLDAFLPIMIRIDETKFQFKTISKSAL